MKLQERPVHLIDPGAQASKLNHRNETSSIVGDASDYMTSTEAALYLHMKRRTLIARANKGELPAVGFKAQRRTTWLFSKRVLDSFLRAKMTANRPRSNQETRHVN